MSSLLLVVEDAFEAGGAGVVLHPRIVVQEAAATPFAVELRQPDGRMQAAQASFDLAHLRNAKGTFALVRVLGTRLEELPPGTEVWRLD